VPGDSAFDDFRLIAAARKTQVVLVGKMVEAHKPDIMAVTGVFRARIPQPGN
jgi:hypothetical protein